MVSHGNMAVVSVPMTTQQTNNTKHHGYFTYTYDCLLYNWSYGSIVAAKTIVNIMFNGYLSPSQPLTNCVKVVEVEKRRKLSAIENVIA